MSIFYYLLKLVLPDWKRMLGAVLLGFCTIGSNIGLMATSAYLISRAALHPPVLELMVAIVGVRFFGISRAVFRYLERYFSHDVTFRILTRVRVWFYQALEPLAPARLVDYRSGDLLSRIVSDVGVLKNLYLRVLAPPLVAMQILILMVIFLAYFDFSLVFIYLLFFMAAGILVPLGIKVVGRRVGQELVAVKARLNVHLVDSLQGITEIVTFAQKQNQLMKVDQVSKEWLSLQGRLSHLTGLSSALTGLCMHLTMWFILVLAITLVQAGKLKGIYLAMLPLAALSSFEAVLPLPLVFQQLEEAMAGAKRLFQITSQKPEIPQTPLAPVGLPEQYNLRLDGISFRYEPTSRWVLKDVSFELLQGQRLAVVGPSGAGKSTLVNLLLRFWEYQEGSIYLGGQKINQYTQEELIKNIAVVSQRTHLFNTTIRENLLLARPDASEEEIIKAAQRAQVHDFIQSLPQGYATYVGEGGFKLSGGQRQRMAIARALLKNAPILILDEATAGLDAVTEREVMANIFQLMEGRTTLLITHRLVGLDVMDEIIVLDQGRVAERGTQQELLQRAGLYGEMWELSRQNFE